SISSASGFISDFMSYNVTVSGDSEPIVLLPPIGRGCCGFGGGRVPPSLLPCHGPASIETEFLLVPPGVSNETLDPVFARSRLLMLSSTVFKASDVLGRLPAELEGAFL